MLILDFEIFGYFYAMTIHVLNVPIVDDGLLQLGFVLRYGHTADVRSHYNSDTSGKKYVG